MSRVQRRARRRFLLREARRQRGRRRDHRFTEIIPPDVIGAFVTAYAMPPALALSISGWYGSPKPSKAAFRYQVLQT